MRLSRRRLLGLAASLPAAAFLGCSAGERRPPPQTPVPPTATPEPPYVVAAGEQERLLLAGTPYETPLWVFGSGVPGTVLAVLGGVHGNEPGGWLAAEQLLATLRPASGAVIILPRANQLAIRDFVRTTEELGDLNRLYPGDSAGLPMAQMARQIVEALREFRAGVLLDLHESWAFYRDRTATQAGTAYLGQTVTSSTPRGLELAQKAAAAVNQGIRAPHEELIVREWPPRGGTAAAPTPGAPSGTAPGSAGPAASFGGGRSSLGLPSHVPGLNPILVEMGQQQPLERRIALHVAMVNEVARLTGVTAA